MDTYYIDTINNLIANNKVMVFSYSYCPFAMLTKGILQDNDIQFEALEFDVHDKGAELQNVLVNKCGKDTVPQVYINGEHIGGNSIMQLYLENGKLK